MTTHRRAGYGLVALVAAVAACLCATVAWGGKFAGGQPTIEANRCDPFVRPCGEPLVLGRAASPLAGPIEVVGMSWAGGPCIYFDQLRRRAGSGYCVESARPKAGFIEATMALNPTRESTEVTGELLPGVQRVVIGWRAGGRSREEAAHVIRVPTARAAQIGASESFAVFVLDVKGCVPAQRFRLDAYGEEGLVGTASFRRPTPC